MTPSALLHSRPAHVHSGPAHVHSGPEHVRCRSAHLHFRLGNGAQAVRFACVGIITTVLYAVLFALLTTVLSSAAANIIALIGSTMIETELMGWYVFGLRGPRSQPENRVRRQENRAHRLDYRVSRQWKGLAAAAVCWAFTAAALQLVGDTSTAIEMSAITAATVAAGVLRYGLLRVWVFAHVDRRGFRAAGDCRLTGEGRLTGGER